MSDLLSSSDWGEFNSAIKDLRDTFFNMDLKIILFEKSYVNPYANTKEASTSKEEYILKALSVYDSKGKAFNERSSIGEIDLSEGYILIYYQDLIDNGLIDPTTNKPLINTTKDEVEFQGERFTLTGGAQVGPIEDQDNQSARFALYKLMFKRQLKNG